MFKIKEGSEYVVYTDSGNLGHRKGCLVEEREEAPPHHHILCQGDYNMTPDRHLG